MAAPLIGDVDRVLLAALSTELRPLTAVFTL